MSPTEATSLDGIDVKDDLPARTGRHRHRVPRHAQRPRMDPPVPRGRRRRGGSGARGGGLGRRIAGAGWATLIYTVAIVAMFGVSAVYHRVHWRSSRAEMWMMRADHSLIFVFIAGSYAPIAMLAMPPREGAQMLTVVCIGAAAGVALKMLWPSAPRELGVPLYLLLGYAAIWFSGTLLHTAGFVVVALLVTEGVLYNIGAIFSACAGPTRGRKPSATTSSSTRSPRPQSCVTTSRCGSSSYRRCGPSAQLRSTSQSATARPISSGASSCRKCRPATATSRWFGQVRHCWSAFPVRKLTGFGTDQQFGRMPPTSTDEGIRLAQSMRTAPSQRGVIVLSNYADPATRGTSNIE